MTLTKVPPSPENTAVHARITAQLGERAEARSSLDAALEQNPGSPVLLRTKGQILYEQNDFPGAAQHGLQAWEKSGRTDEGAWALYQLSKGRSVPSGTGASAPGASSLTQGQAAVSADDSSKPYKLSVKGSVQVSAVPSPGEAEKVPAKRKGLPLWPLAVPLAGGLIAYGVYRGTKQPEAQETEQPAIGALLTSPALVKPGKLAGGVFRTIAKGAVIKTLGDIAVTGAVAAGVLVAGGAVVIMTVNHGLNEMIAAQDKYNDAIDTRRPSEAKFKSRPNKKIESEKNDDCSLKPGEDILTKFLDGTRLASGFLQHHEGPGRGHTRRDHVGQSLKDLARQIKAGKNDASSYPDITIAEEIARRAIENNRSGVEAWFVGRTKARFPARYTGSPLRSIGYTISEQNPSVPLPKYDGVAVLQKFDGCRILILTSHPQ